MKTRIRPAEFAEIDQLQQLIAQSARGLSVGYYTPIQIEAAVAHIFGVDTQLVRDGTYLVVEVNGEIAACGGWSKRKTLYGGDQHKRDTPDPLLDPATEPARIRAFFVHPSWGRRGLGKLLLEACEDAARAEGYKALELGGTLPGVPFYAALGFRELENIDIDLPGNVTLPIIRMRKEL